jgi:uncharacterized protein YjiS (DUF1127 family)
MYKIMEYETSSLTTGLYDRFDPPRSSADRDQPGTMIDGIVREIRHWHNEYVIARTTAALMKLDDFALRDIGMSRNDIAAAARNAVENPDYPPAS